MIFIHVKTLIMLKIFSEQANGLSPHVVRAGDMVPAGTILVSGDPCLKCFPFSRARA